MKIRISHSAVWILGATCCANHILAGGDTDQWRSAYRSMSLCLKVEATVLSDPNRRIEEFSRLIPIGTKKSEVIRSLRNLMSNKVDGISYELVPDRNPIGFSISCFSGSERRSVCFTFRLDSKEQLLEIGSGEFQSN